MSSLTSRQRPSSSRPDNRELPPQAPISGNLAIANGAPRSGRAASVPNGNHSSRGSPVVSILRKLLCLIARDVHLPAPSGNAFLDFARDVAFGTVCGVLFILVVGFVGYFVPIRSGSRLRSAAYELITDPEWMNTIEESIDVKFLERGVHDAIGREISRGASIGQQKHENHLIDLAANKEKLEALKKEHKELLSKIGVSLDNWCGGCKGGWGNCDKRVQYLVDTYNTDRDRAKIDIMKGGKCLKPSK